MVCACVDPSLFIVFDLYPPRARSLGFCITHAISNVSRDLSVDKVNPVDLRGLKQAVYVLQSLEQGKTADQIVDKFKGDRQLVEIWTNFLIHNHWIERTNAGGFSATGRGKDWVDRTKEIEAS